MNCPACDQPLPSADIACPHCAQRPRSVLVTLVGIGLLICAALIVISAVVPAIRYVNQEDYRQRTIDDVAERARTEEIGRQRRELEAMPNRWPRSLETLEERVVINRDAVDAALRRKIKQTVIVSLTFLPLLVLLGIGVIRRWRWARIVGIILGVLFILSSTVKALPALERPSQYDHHFWGPVATGFFLGILLLFGLIGRRKKAEFASG